MASSDDSSSTPSVDTTSLDESGFFSHVAQTTRLSRIVITAGQVGARRGGGGIPQDKRDEIVEALNNLRHCLESAGAGVRDILKLTYYIVDYDPTQPLHKAPIEAFLEGHKPATTLVPVPRLAHPSMRFEIEATAAVPQYPASQVGVVVIGAGLSGLQSALTLQKAGVRVKVLEARSRVGGKIWSRQVEGGCVEAGAAWINSTNQPMVYSLARRLGLNTVIQNTTGRIIADIGDDHQLQCFEYGSVPGADIHEQRSTHELIDTIEHECMSLDSTVSDKARKLDVMTFAQWIQSLGCSKKAYNMVSIGVRAMLGVEMEDVSALYFLAYCRAGGGYKLMRSDREGGGQYMRITNETSSLARGLADSLLPSTVQLQSPVRRVEQKSDGTFLVYSVRGLVKCSRVILAIPTPLYKNVAFSPPLPASKTAITSAMKLGHYSKMILIYKKAWWRSNNLCGMMLSSSGPVSVTRDTSVDGNDHYSLTCFIVAASAAQWAKLSKQKRADVVLQQLREVYGSYAKVEEPLHVIEQVWMHEAWSQGAPCPVPGLNLLSNAGYELSAKFGHLHSAGTEMSNVWKGYMEGAMFSGERCAQEVLKAMSSVNL